MDCAFPSWTALLGSWIVLLHHALANYKCGFIIFKIFIFPSSHRDPVILSREIAWSFLQFFPWITFPLFIAITLMNQHWKLLNIIRQYNRIMQEFLMAFVTKSPELPLLFRKIFFTKNRRHFFVFTLIFCPAVESLRDIMMFGGMRSAFDGRLCIISIPVDLAPAYLAFIWIYNNQSGYTKIQLSV